MAILTRVCEFIGCAHIDLVDYTGVMTAVDYDHVCKVIFDLCQDTLPEQKVHSTSLMSMYGRPSILTRYWPMGTFFAFSGSTILKLLFNRRANLVTWAMDTYTTITDFWRNWVITPIVNIISTIRHEDSSQIALMSGQSLQADMDSLERMVVDFAKDNRQYIHSNISNTQDAMEIIRLGVREGNLSPVLRAYESDLRTPLKSAVTGTLIRTLLIQIQKTKVDVEVALSGIDRLLKSQQLVFGFVGVTPSLIILYTLFRYFSSLPTRRRGLRQGIAKEDAMKTLRTIDRIVGMHDDDAFPGEFESAQRGQLGYKESGLLICNSYLLRRFVSELPGKLQLEFMSDLTDLENVALGVERQRRTVARIWRVWGKFLI
jgi:nuclear control of ATPase protein 2